MTGYTAPVWPSLCCLREWSRTGTAQQLSFEGVILRHSRRNSRCRRKRRYRPCKNPASASGPANLAATVCHSSRRRQRYSWEEKSRSGPSDTKLLYMLRKSCTANLKDRQILRKDWRLGGNGPLVSERQPCRPRPIITAGSQGVTPLEYGGMGRLSSKVSLDTATMFPNLRAVTNVIHWADSVPGSWADAGPVASWINVMARMAGTSLSVCNEISAPFASVRKTR